MFSNVSKTESGLYEFTGSQAVKTSFKLLWKNGLINVTGFLLKTALTNKST